jgi:co-chaperonin GroES (HSP10)
MFQPILNNVLIKVKTKYIGNYTNIMKAANLNPGNQLNPAELVNIMGEIVALPLKVEDRPGIKGFSIKDMQVGDVAIFRYDLIFSINMVGDQLQYKNLVWHKGQELWSCSIDKIFAVIRDEKIIPVNGYCFVENLSDPTTIVLPQYMRRFTKAASGTLTQIGNNLTHLDNIEAKVGDTVYFDPSLISVYQMKGKPFGVIKQHQILGHEADVYDLAVLN